MSQVEPWYFLRVSVIQSEIRQIDKQEDFLIFIRSANPAEKIWYRYAELVELRRAEERCACVDEFVEHWKKKVQKSSRPERRASIWSAMARTALRTP